ncbi:carboxylate--amine ligase [Nocardioides sp. Root190]|uniref:carboxylate-amine ligase n=1 Tax=Nocardioides sp. Root190 TaxID=1736488 RepID=UPI0006F37A9B|nr:glutamate--cysteine ligase [Nocardioides sp. Root190]KRB74032.1 carboxylate--amine ligase [Nocardioides sp. Root190]
MTHRTVGVEEELLLVDPETREASPSSQQVLKYAAEHHLGGAGDLEHELYRHQLETRTSPTTDLGDLREDLLRGRRTAAEAAAGAGLLTAAVGAIPLGDLGPRTTRDDRYLDMVDSYGELARPGGTCGMHVHVSIASAEEGVRVIDGLRPWLAVLLAISANSPFHHDRDTRHASWRAQAWGQWPSAGPTERFGDLDTYRRVGRALVASGAARDEGMLYYDARLARRFPTVEVRIADVCTDPDDAVLVAAITRALVHHCAASTEDADSSARWRAELVGAARWRAARYGVAGKLLDPASGDLRPAREVLELLLATLRETLESYGDVDLVSDGINRVLTEGGAVRQRAAFERSGSLVAVVDDLVARTNLDDGRNAR